MGAGVVNGSGGNGSAVSADFHFFMVDANGVRYPIADITGLEDVAFVDEAFLMLKEGERVECEVTPGAGAPDAYVSAQYLDVQGPIHQTRVKLTDKYQDIIPAPAAGQSHIPLIGIFSGSGHAATNYSFSLAAEDTTGGADIDLARAVNGVIVQEADKNPTIIKDGFAGVDDFDKTGLGIPVALSEGESIRAKTDSSPAEAGTRILVIPYLVVTPND